MDKKKIGIACLVVVLLTVMFLLGRNSNKQTIVIHSPNSAKYQRAIDSLTSLNRDYKDSVKNAYTMIDSLKNKKLINNKKVKNEIKQIKNFTPTSRQRFHDSVMLSNGFR